MGYILRKENFEISVLGGHSHYYHYYHYYYSPSSSSSSSSSESGQVWWTAGVRDVKVLGS